MRSQSFAALVGFCFLASASIADAYFIVDLTDGGELRADYVREESDVVYVAREAGELRIERSRIRGIREIDPGIKVDVTKRVVDGLPSAPEAPATVPPTSSVGPGERENQVVRRIIVGQRDLLFARLRGDAPDALATRERELKALKRQRAEIQRTSSSRPAAR
jgi:hypothetical protein